MEKLEEESAAKFINALIKSVQTLCHGYLDFNNGIEIIGHINLNVDKGSSLHYILEEKVCKNEENSTLFISNSFHAQNQKPDSKVKGRNSESAHSRDERTSSADSVETGKVSSAISSISSALTKSHERLHSASTSSGKDSDSTHSKPASSTAKRKASDDFSNDVRAAKSSHLSSSPSPVSHFLTHSPHDPSDSKASLKQQSDDLGGTVLPQTAGVGGDGSGDLGVNLAGSVLERVDDHSNSDLPDRGDESDGDLEVTFIKEEYVEGEQSACQFDNSVGQQYGRGAHQSASSDMQDASMYPGSLHLSASSTFVPSSHDMSASQHHGPSTSSSQPHPGTSGVRGAMGWPPGAHGHGMMGVSRTLTGAPPNSMANKLHSMAIKTYICHICKYSSTYLTNYKRHMRRHTGQLFRCDVCGVKYNCRYYLQKHILRNHGVQSQGQSSEVSGSGAVFEGGAGQEQAAHSVPEVSAAKATHHDQNSFGNGDSGGSFAPGGAARDNDQDVGVESAAGGGAVHTFL